MTQDEKLIWSAVYAAVQIDLVGANHISQFDIRRAVDVADETIVSLRKHVAKNGSVHRDKNLAMELEYTTPIEGVEL